jgi:hypothetical protein
MQVQEEAMNQQDRELFEQTLIKYADQHLANGGRIICGKFNGFTEGECCPVAATMENFFQTRSRDVHKEYCAQYLSSVLQMQISNDELFSFIFGFDGRSPEKGSDPECYQIGQKLRGLYITGEIEPHEIKAMRTPVQEEPKKTFSTDWIEGFVEKSKGLEDAPPAGRPPKKSWWKRVWEWVKR